jgi:hypothetical protein
VVLFSSPLTFMNTSKPSLIVTKLRSKAQLGDPLARLAGGGVSRSPASSLFSPSCSALLVDTCLLLFSYAALQHPRPSSFDRLARLGARKPPLSSSVPPSWLTSPLSRRKAPSLNSPRRTLPNLIRNRSKCHHLSQRHQGCKRRNRPSCPWDWIDGQ